MIKPIEYKGRTPLNSLTGIKSSLGKLRTVVALTYLLYLANGKQAKINYSVTKGSIINLKDEYVQFIKNYLHNNSIDSLLQDNPLLTSQIESLYVGITLMFGLGKISFENKSLSMTKERTGGVRYPKVIEFSSNIITLDLVLSSIDENRRITFLTSWLKDERLADEMELKVATLLNLNIENNLFKLRNGEDDIFFQTEGIYLGLNEDDAVSLDSDEKVGPARILNSMLSEGLIPWLNVNKSRVTYNASSDFNYKAYSKIVSTSLDIRDIKVDKSNSSGSGSGDTSAPTSEMKEDLFTALRTKPFLLLAGISGTGKSQKVQELAFMTCPEGELRDPKSTTPGNYQLVEVKPNWHDSTELLGYYSALSGKYELTDFIRFTYKALQNKDVPFFLCLDEMNLAPVEQYFAEFLSVLETRKKVGEDIETQPLLTKDRFSNCEVQKKVLVKEDGDILEDGKQYKMEFLYSEDDTEIINYLKENGLHLPDNLFVIGTVNMDDTTHQFSRKVIDRAFTIEMNGGKMANMLTPESKTLLEYREEPVSLAAFKSRFVRAYEVLDDPQFAKYADTIKKRIPELLGDSDGTAKDNNPESINGILNDTPFRVSYRVQNELVLYLSVLIENAGFPEDIESCISEAVLAILLEKVLPRVQGEKKQLETKDGKSNILKDMKVFVENHFKPEVGEDEEIASDSLYMKVIKKLEEMDGKLSGYYTNFF